MTSQQYWVLLLPFICGCLSGYFGKPTNYLIYLFIGFGIAVLGQAIIVIQLNFHLVSFINNPVAIFWWVIALGIGLTGRSFVMYMRNTKLYMRPIFLPIVTSFISLFIAPILAALPYSIALFPVVAFATILMFYIPALECGFIIGLTFILIPNKYFIELLSLQKWKCILYVTLIGFICGTFVGLISPSIYKETASDMIYSLFFNYAKTGALTTLCLWPIIKIYLAPKQILSIEATIENSL